MTMTHEAVARRERRGGTGAARAVAALGLVVAGLTGSPSVFADAPVDSLHGGTGSGVKVLGHTDLGGEGLNGQVAVLGSTAVVATGYVPLSRLSLAHLVTAALNTRRPAEPCR